MDPWVKFICPGLRPITQLAGSSRKETELCAFGFGWDGEEKVKNVKGMGREAKQVAPCTPKGSGGALDTIPKHSDVGGWHAV